MSAPIGGYIVLAVALTEKAKRKNTTRITVGFCMAKHISELVSLNGL